MPQLLQPPARVRPSAAPRPAPRSRPAGAVDDFDLPSDAERFTRTLIDFAGAFTASVLLHFAVLLVLAGWYLANEPDAEGYVIDATFVTGDEGALPVVQTILEKAESADEGRAAGPALAGAGTGSSAAVSAVPFPGGAGNDLDPFATGGRVAGGGVGFFGTRAAGRSFAFVVDCSGSMQGDRFSRAVDELIRAIQELDPAQRFYVVLYNDHAVPMFGPGPAGELLPATQDNRVRVRRWLRSRSAGGGTQPQEALKQALRLRPDVLFFLSDGEIPADTPAAARGFNGAGTVIHTTGFTSREGESLLKAIADESGGRYRFIE